jgi:Antibiotic biosynthesis monooxygenase
VTPAMQSRDPRRRAVLRWWMSLFGVSAVARPGPGGPVLVVGGWSFTVAVPLEDLGPENVVESDPRSTIASTERPAMPIVITGYEIDRDADVPAIASANPSRQILRATAPGGRFGFVDITPVEDPAAAGDLVRAATTGSASAVAGAYEVFHTNDRPAPPFAAGAERSSVIFVNFLECRPENEDAAFELWGQVNAYMVTKPGYRWHRLHRRIEPDAPFGFVNVVEWESAAAWQAAHDDGFRALAIRPEMPFVAYPTLCLPVVDGRVATPA